MLDLRYFARSARPAAGFTRFSPLPGWAANSADQKLAARRYFLGIRSHCLSYAAKSHGIQGTSACNFSSSGSGPTKLLNNLSTLLRPLDRLLAINGGTGRHRARCKRVTAMGRELPTIATSTNGGWVESRPRADAGLGTRQSTLTGSSA